jgi:hypothetical protein
MTSIDHGRATGIVEMFPKMGPMPVKDVTGYRAAVYMLLESMKAGKYHKDHQQFDSIRKLWSTFRNIWGASAEEGASMSFYLGFDDKKKQTISSCPTLSDWFSRFTLGCKKRMGQDVRPQLGISIEAMHALMLELESQFLEVTIKEERNLIVNAGAYAILTFCCSLRGNETFLLDLAGLRSHIRNGLTGINKHVSAPLLGRFKGEDGEKYHLLFMPPTTASGLKCRVWMERLVEQRTKEGRFRGPALCGTDGKVLNPGMLEVFLLELLVEIQNKHPEIIDLSVDVYEEMGISRSFRRGATTHARNMGVSEADIDSMNRWRKFEAAQGRRPVMPMRDHYCQLIANTLSELTKLK